MSRDVDELDDDEPQRKPGYVDGAWGRTANPNTVEGELQNVAAFATGLTKLTGWRRTTARLIVLAILVSLIVSIIVGIAHGY